MNAFSITTTIPYVNARPHVGFALELVQADVLARHRRRCGHRVHLQTGTDEHAIKNVQAAREAGEAIRPFVDRHAAAFADLAAGLGCSHDRFLRTSEPAHHRAVAAFWQALDPGDLYRHEYAGRYCPGCEDFVTGRDLVDGRCPDHGTAPETVRERNWFFRLSRYTDRLVDLINSDRLRIEPTVRRNEVLAFLDRGLKDISVSRCRERTEGWGVPVPGDEDQTVYVWIDALVNYLSGLGYGDGEAWRHWWNRDVDRVHVIGKNVWKFHAIYWPALLLSAGLEPPSTLLVHGFLTVDGSKISKSAGNGGDPLALVERYGVDALRYALLCDLPVGGDADFSEERLRERYRADLANGLGNCCSRLCALAGKVGFGRFDPGDGPPADRELDRLVGDLALDRALALIRRRVDDLNGAIERKRPWERVGDAGLPPLLEAWLRDLDGIAADLGPFLPGTAARIRDHLRRDRVERIEPLFPRLE